MQWILTASPNKIFQKVNLIRLKCLFILACFIMQQEAIDRRWTRLLIIFFCKICYILQPDRFSLNYPGLTAISVDMKILLLSFFCITLCYTGKAQKRCAYPACWADFIKNKLYIVQTGLPSFDSALKIAITNEWTVSQVGGYISKKEFETLKRLDGKSFLEPAVNSWYIPKSPSQREEHSACALSFFEGHTVYPSTYINYESIDLLEGNSTESFNASIYRLSLIIRGRNNYYLSGDTKRDDAKGNGLSFLKAKTLLISDNAVHNSSTKLNLFEENAFANYQYKIALADDDKIRAVIQSKDSNYVLAVRLVNGLGSGLLFLDVATGSELGKLITSEWTGAIRSTEVEMLEQKIKE